MRGFDLESFFPQKERFALALMLNNLIAAPGFALWREGEPLDIAHCLRTPEGRPRAAVFYLAQLPEEQRCFFVTLFLAELRAWVRRQPGTQALRALLYFDEVYGYLPPYPANPPTKAPLLALVKQGRAAGLGLLLATQNPADLDYKGLGNIGTWLVGALRTERDKERVLEGLEGAIAQLGQRPAAIEAALSRLQPRRFLLHVARAGTLRFFASRWALSYLRGPVGRAARLSHICGRFPDGATDGGRDLAKRGGIFQMAAGSFKRERNLPNDGGIFQMLAGFSKRGRDLPNGGGKFKMRGKCRYHFYHLFLLR